jgi:hypothetical protein
MTNAEPGAADPRVEALRSVLDRAAGDADLRARLTADPAATLQAEGVDVDPDLPIQVLQLPLTRAAGSLLPVTADGRQLLVIPNEDADAELSDDELGDVAAGWGIGETLYNLWAKYLPPSADDLAQADRDLQRWRQHAKNPKM